MMNAMNCLEIFGVKYNIYEVITMETIRYDDDNNRPLSQDTLEAIEEAKEIVAAWKKLRKE